MRRVIELLLLMFIALQSYKALACEQNKDCVGVNQWQLGVAVGIGVRSNPLVDGDSIPLVILPDIAWYGESAYFDNGELGYQWYQHPKQAFTTFIRTDPERAFFSFWHPANVLFSLNSEGVLESEGAIPGTPSDLPIKPTLSINAIASRDWAFNAGVRWYYYLNEGQFTLSFEQDISNVHQGSRGKLSYQHRWQWRDWSFSLTPAITYKSAQLSNYYYGISQADNVDEAFYYRAKSGWQPSLAMAIQKPFNDKWQWLFRASYQHLHAGMRNSPLVKENSIKSVFFGLAYRF